MVSYNVTIIINLDKEKEWLTWMQEDHIPNIMMSGYFVEYRLWRLESLDESEGITYSFQLLCKDQETLDLYLQEKAVEFRNRLDKKFDPHFVSFRSRMRLIESG